MSKNMIVPAPPITPEGLAHAALLLQTDRELAALVEELNDEYLYWDRVRYKASSVPSVDATELWACIKVSRGLKQISAWPRYGLTLSITNRMQRQCHQFDLYRGEQEASGLLLEPKGRERMLISSLMEEAIFSSQIEGASTTRRVAKEMLLRQTPPRDKSQQMIYNNYQTIRFITEHRNEAMTPELILYVHELMTHKTLEHEADAGRFRSNDDVVVANEITGDVVHYPPRHEEIPECIEELCSFFNEVEASSSAFIHPLLRGVIIHFMVGYVHPFVDGNGRTARALFYWYLLRRGYWLTEYLSISRVIASSKARYERAYLYTEGDGMDLGYFVSYNLQVLERAFAQLQQYLERKQAERPSAETLLRLGGINERQAQILQLLQANPQELLTIKDLQTRFLISPSTAKADLRPLLEQGLVREISLNKVKRGYVRGERLDEALGDR